MGSPVRERAYVTALAAVGKAQKSLRTTFEMLSLNSTPRRFDLYLYSGLFLAIFSRLGCAFDKNSNG